MIAGHVCRRLHEAMDYRFGTFADGRALWIGPAAVYPWLLEGATEPITPGTAS